MLPGIASIAGRGSANSTLMQVITSLGLTTNLKLCLDAGDASSYTSGQSWLDRSGGGYDFFRGTTSGSQSSDPTFNGSPGGQSTNEYFSFDGGDFFRYDTTNESWMQNLHKNNAKFSLAAWLYFPDGSASWNAISTGPTAGGGAGIGVDVIFSLPFGYVIFTVGNGALLTAYTVTGMGFATGWNFCALTVDEAANSIRGVRNATQATSTCTYSSPSAANASYTAEIGSLGNGTNIIESGCRVASMAMWEQTALTSANFTSIFNATRATFGV